MNQENRPTQPDYGECPVCHGTGWEVYSHEVEGYPAPLSLARICPRCKGRRRVNDQTGIPPEYRDADISKFDYSVYQHNTDRMAKVFTSFVEDFEKWGRQGKGLYLWS